MPVITPNPKQVENVVVSEPESTQYKIKKIRLASNATDLVVTHSSAAEA